MLRTLFAFLVAGLGFSWMLSPAWGACQTTPAGALTFNDALLRVDCHPMVRSTDVQLRATQADERIAGQAPNPTLTLGANSLSRQGYGGGGLMNKTFDHQLRVDQLIERGGKRDLRMQGAQLQTQAAVSDTRQARLAARADIAAAYLDAYTARARVEALTQFAEFSARSLALTETRVRLGDAPALDLARLRLDDSRLKADLGQARADAKAALLQLALLLYWPQGVPLLESASPWPMAQTWAPESADVQALLERRPDVRAASARRAAAERARDLAMAQRTRDISVGVQADRYPTSLANPSGNGNTVSLTLSVPLFLAHAYEGEIARGLADLESALEQEHQTREAARAQIEQSLAQLQASATRRRLAIEELEPSAQKLADGAELAYARGGISMLELLEARRNLRAARLERLAAEAEWAKAYLQWQSMDANNL